MCRTPLCWPGAEEPAGIKACATNVIAKCSVVCRKMRASTVSSCMVFHILALGARGPAHIRLCWGAGSSSAPSQQLRAPSDLGEHRDPPALLPVSVSGREEPPRPAHAEGKPGVSTAKPQTTVCSQRIKNADWFRSRDAKYLPSEHHAGVLLPARQNPL